MYIILTIIQYQEFLWLQYLLFKGEDIDDVELSICDIISSIRMEIDPNQENKSEKEIKDEMGGKILSDINFK